MKIIQSLKDSGQYDNTLIIYIQGDNGGSGEGGLGGLVDELTMVDGTPERRFPIRSAGSTILAGPRHILLSAGWG